MKSRRSPPRRARRRQGSAHRPPKRYRVSLDSNACIGCLACTKCEIFKVGEDMRAHAVCSEVGDPERCREAAEACPVGAIVIKVISKTEGRPSISCPMQ